LVKDFKLEANVKFLGFVSEEELIKIYNTSDIFVIMSTAETQCIAAIKALACGVPVIAAKSWGLKEYINEKNGFLVEAGDVESLAEKIRFLYKNKSERIQKGKRGKEDVKLFSPKYIASIWERIYKNAINKRFSNP
jgi:glycosyltransferase involved in cell wall biosynthesis